MPLGAARGKGALGTFAGVFTPSVLTILGIILFMRLGYVVGSAGLGRALVILALSMTIAVLTSVSVAAIATNMTVKGGGDYYLISRTLGVEFGGAIGCVLFLAQSVSVAFYCIGFGEAVAAILPLQPVVAPRIIACMAVGLLFVFAWLGADWATRFQYVVMTVLAAALGSFFVGGAGLWSSRTFALNWTAPANGADFWIMFAIFFPAVTGFTQGVSMSGDLKEPGRSIPLGTFAAVGFSTVVYAAVAVIIAGVLPGEELRRDYASMRRMAHVAGLIDAGVLAATLSSGMASFLGAPRILQSMARDRIFRLLVPFARGHGPADNPRLGVLLAAGIALVTVGLGNLNFIAPVVSMFFLTSYGLLNFATFYEARAASPSFRPRLRWFDARVSLLGGLGCLGAMVAISPVAGSVSATLLFAIYQYLKRTAGPARWADGSRSYHFQRVRDHLYEMAAGYPHPRDWRPQLLAFSSDSGRREQILRFASWVEGKCGVTTAVQILEGAGGDARKRRKEAEEELREDIARSGVQAFPLVVEGPDLGSVAHVLLQSFGIGPIRANTILLNWREQAPAPQSSDRRYGRHLRMAVRLGCNVVALAAEEEKWARLVALPVNQRRIDVLWCDAATGRLNLLLAYLMTRSDEWREAKIRVVAGASSEEAAEATRRRVEKMLDEVRITAEAEVIAGLDSERIADLASDSALIFLPMRLRGDLVFDPFGESPEVVLEHLPVTALVAAAEDIELDVQPDEGRAAEIAVAMDAAAEAEGAARAAEKEAAALARVAEKKRQDLGALGEQASKEERAAAEAGAREAEAAAAKAMHRQARAHAQAEAAAQAAEEMGAKAPKADSNHPRQPKPAGGNSDDRAD